MNEFGMVIKGLFNTFGEQINVMDQTTELFKDIDFENLLLEQELVTDDKYKSIVKILNILNYKISFLKSYKENKNNDRLVEIENLKEEIKLLESEIFKDAYDIINLYSKNDNFTSILSYENILMKNLFIKDNFLITGSDVDKNIEYSINKVNDNTIEYKLHSTSYINNILLSNSNKIVAVFIINENGEYEKLVQDINLKDGYFLNIYKTIKSVIIVSKEGFYDNTILIRSNYTTENSSISQSVLVLKPSLTTMKYSNLYTNIETEYFFIDSNDLLLSPIEIEVKYINNRFKTNETIEFQNNKLIYIIIDNTQKMIEIPIIKLKEV